jgi:hypothetical protein
MPNPWLDIPLADYEGHMASPEVRQLEALSELFAEALELRRPGSIVILGVAGGNGLDRIDSKVTERVVGVDINPLYLKTVRQRYSHLRGLVLHCADLAEETLHLPPVELVYAALVFEHAGTGRCLDNALRLVSEGGALSIVVQLPSAIEQNVGKSGFTSLERLQSHFKLVDPDELRALLQKRGYSAVHETRRSLPAGKAFWMGVFAHG